MTTIKLKNGSGAPTAGDLVQGEPALDLTNKRLYTENASGTVIEVGTNPTSITTGDITATGTATFANLATSGDITFGDNDKAIFGAGSDLQIYHDGSNSYIDDAAVGNLNIRGNNIVLGKYTGETAIECIANGAVKIYHDNSNLKLATTSTGIDITGNATFNDNGKAIFGAGSDLQIYHNGSHSLISESGTGNLYIQGSSAVFLGSSTQNQVVVNDGADVKLRHNGTDKLATTSTGINVIGTVVSDNLTVDGGAIVNSSTTPSIRLTETDVTGENTQIIQAGGTVRIRSASDDYATVTERMRIVHGTGDISFYNDAGSSQDLYWDASTSRLGLGTTNPFSNLHVHENSTGASQINISNTEGSFNLRADGDSGRLYADTLIAFNEAGTSEYIRIGSGGDVRIGKTSSGIGIVGHEFGPTGYTYHTRDGGTVLDLNRLTSDGKIAKFYKDGAEVGNIGTISGEFYIAHDNTTDSGLRFRNGIIQPCNNTGGSNDAAVSLGQPSMRFADLYLSGGAYLGGTASANYLDDYEEGTWTPTLTGLTIGNGTIAGSYVKVGKMVTCNCIITLGSTSSVTGDTTATLPFTATRVGVGAVKLTETGVANYVGFGEHNTGSVFVRYASGSTYAQSRPVSLSATAPFTWGATDTITISVTYETT